MVFFFRRIVIRRLELIFRIAVWWGWQWSRGWVHKYEWEKYNLGPIEIDIIREWRREDQLHR